MVNLFYLSILVFAIITLVGFSSHNAFAAGTNLIIQKNALGGNLAFQFTTSGGSPLPPSFSITTKAGAGNFTFSNVTPGTIYIVKEIKPPGWIITGATCSNGNDPQTGINIAVGQTVTCAFNNTKTGSIIIQKNTVGGNGAFNFTTSGGLPLPSTFSIVTTGSPTGFGTRTFSNVIPGTSYSVSEMVPPGWALTSATCNNGNTPQKGINVLPGKTVTCTFNDTKTGTIIVQKNAVGGNRLFNFTTSGGSPLPSSFTIATAGSPIGTGTRTYAGVIPTTSYSVHELVPPGWVLTSAACSNGNNPEKRITVLAGQTVTCTFNDTKSGSSIIIQKNAVGGNRLFNFTTSGGSPLPSSFTIGTAGSPIGTGTRTFANVIPGTSYSVHELVPPGWTLTSATCSNGNNPQTGITVSVSQIVTCTFNDTKSGSTLIIQKNTIGGNGQFNFNTTGGLPLPSTFSIVTTGSPTGTGSRTFAVVPSTTYTVNEVVPLGWTLTSATCTNGNNPQTGVTVLAGQTVACTFNDSK